MKNIITEETDKDYYLLDEYIKELNTRRQNEQRVNSRLLNIIKKLKTNQPSIKLFINKANCLA